MFPKELYYTERNLSLTTSTSTTLQTIEYRQRYISVLVIQYHYFSLECEISSVCIEDTLRVALHTFSLTRYQLALFDLPTYILPYGIVPPGMLVMTNMRPV